MHVRCPHCHNHVEILDDSSFKDIVCSTCGSAFSLVGDTEVTQTAGYTAKTIGQFELVEQLGVGAFGSVWKAKDTQLDRTVAIKIPRKGQLSEEETEKFLREARSAAQLRHANIVSVHEVGTSDDSVYIVSDYVEGADLKEWLRSQPLPAREAAQLCAKIAEALHHAHEAGVIHRDLKPGNIMMDLHGQPHIMDFGLAKRESGEMTMTVDGAILGTPAYMSPEQAKGKGHEADRRSDVYSLGTMLFEMLTGELPFRGEKRILIVQILTEEPPKLRRLNPRVPKDLETICVKCLEKEPERRYATTQAVADELRRFLIGEPITARPISAPDRAWRWCKRNPLVASLGSLLGMVLLVLAVVGPLVAINQTRLARDKEELAVRQTELAEQNKELAETERLKSQQLERQLRISRVMRLSAQSQSIGKETPVQSLRLAIEAVEASRQIDGDIVPIAHGTARLWNLSTANQTSTPIILPGHNDIVTSVAFGPNNRWLVTASFDKTARLWDLSNQNANGSPIVLRGHEDWVNCVAIGPDGQWLATGSKDRTVRLWDLTAEDPSQSPLILRGHDDAVLAMVISPDGRWLFTGSWAGLRRWDLSGFVAKAPSALPVLRHPGKVGPVAISPDGLWLATGSADGTARMWGLSDLGPTDSFHVLSHHNSVTSLTFSPDSRWLATGSLDKTARLWDVTDDEPGNSFIELTGHEEGIEAVSISRNGHWLATGGGGTVRLWNLQSRNVASSGLVLGGHDGSIGSLALSPNGRWLVAGGIVGASSSDTLSSDTATLWDLTAHPNALPLVLRAEQGALRVALISPNNRWLVTGSMRGARLWDLSSADINSSSIVLPNASRVTSVAFSPDSCWVAVANTVKEALLWDLTADDPTANRIELRGHGAFLTRIAFSPDGLWLATGSGDSTVRLWNLASGDPNLSTLALRGHQLSIDSLVFSPNGRWLVSTSDNGETARLWDLDVGLLLAKARRVASRELTPEERKRYMVHEL